MAQLDPKEMPGCGLAAFALLLLAIFLTGLTGIGVSTFSILSAGEQLTPQRLSYGGVVDTRMLEGLRDAGVLGPAEIPDAYHAENASGSEACAIASGRVVRIGTGGPQQIAIATITEVGGTDEAVSIVGDHTFVCFFDEGEGGDRFRRMLEHR